MTLYAVPTLRPTSRSYGPFCNNQYGRTYFNGTCKNDEYARSTQKERKFLNGVGIAAACVVAFIARKPIKKALKFLAEKVLKLKKPKFVDTIKNGAKKVVDKIKDVDAKDVKKAAETFEGGAGI